MRGFIREAARRDRARPRSAPAGRRRVGREQGEHGAAEAAAHDARAERPGLVAGRRRRARPRGPTPRSRRGGSRARRRAARRAPGSRRPRSAATAASTRSFSLITWRTRRSSGSGQAGGVAGVAQRVDAEQLGGRGGTRRGARCSRSAARLRGAPESSMASTWPPSSSWTALSLERRACRAAARGPRCPSSEASWSSRPVSAPRVVVLDARAEPRQLDAAAAARRPAARAEREQSETQSAAEEASPAPLREVAAIDAAACMPGQLEPGRARSSAHARRARYGIVVAPGSARRSTAAAVARARPSP